MTAFVKLNRVSEPRSTTGLLAPTPRVPAAPPTSIPNIRVLRPARSQPRAGDRPKRVIRTLPNGPVLRVRIDAPRHPHAGDCDPNLLAQSQLPRVGKHLAAN